MTDTYEISASDSAPVEIYDYGYSGHSYRYTSSDEIEVVDSLSYTPIPITRSELKPAIVKEKASLTVTLPIACELAEVFRVSPPSEVVTLTIRRYNRASGVKRVIWMGRVINAKFTNLELELSHESIMTSVQRTILTRTYQKGCPYTLFRSGCNLDETAFKVSTNAHAIAGNTVTILGTFTDNHFAGGEFRYMSSITGIMERRFVISNVGGAITLDRFPYGLLAGMPIDVLPGCAHNIADCKNKFNNLVNYGGQPYIPTKNPVSGTSIY